MEVRYSLLLKKSLHDFKKNPVLLLPLVFTIFIGIFLFLIFFTQVIVFGYLNLSYETNLIKFIILLLIFIFIDIILLILSGALINSMYFGLLHAIITKKEALVKDMWNGASKFTILYSKFYLVKLLLFVVPISVLALLIFIGFLISKGTGIVFAFIFGAVLILYLLALWLLFTFGFLFFAPIMTKSRTNSVILLIKESLKYTRENLGHAVLTWLIVFVISLTITIANQILGFLIKVLPSISLVFVILTILLTVFAVLLIIWLKIFLFNSYFNYNLKNL
ncbi:hypothetical protein HYU23_02695 [Candidatus Woesearchaeota archaeon]|nr:hypothetical protein [Candidatus Woesearchaeota archaeon]